ncbi:MAG TPA: Glu/Leu/Phe/Val dehydrogenase [Ignavibacteriaceae bacterium]|nr:Glu/Leu/Phe/Val dehydrogenase [Ignavibacteriaceae bacterium]
MINFEVIEEFDHEQVVFCSNKEAGLRAIIAIHNTTLGPALGGTRMWNYKSHDDAFKDVLRLSRGMTYKAAVSGLNLGGGKAVIIGDSSTQKNELLFRTFGKFIEGLAGRYITAEDVGTSVTDMEYVRMETKYVTGVSKALGGSGDPSPVTAYGVFVGMKACAKFKWGSDSLAGKKIAVQGAGQVARYLCEHLYNEGAEIFLTDINELKVQKVLETVKAQVVKPEEIYGLDVDIFSPNALGAIINNNTIGKLKAEIVAGGANNQLEKEDIHGPLLMENGILYAPDYVINAGGLMNVANELEGYRQDRALKQAEKIYDVIGKILEISAIENIPTHEASNKMAEERLKSVGKISNIYTGHSDFSGRLGELFQR